MEIWIAALTRHGNETAEAGGHGETQEQARAAAIEEAARNIETNEDQGDPSPIDLIEQDIEQGNLTLTLVAFGCDELTQ